MNEEMELKALAVVKRELAAAYQAGYAAGQAERDQLRAKLAEYTWWNGEAQEISERVGWPCAYTPHIRNVGIEDMTHALTAAYARGAAEEREACAKIAEADLRSEMAITMNYEPTRYVHGRAIAKRIRSRTGGENECTSRPSCDGPSSTAYDDSGYAKEPGQ